MRKVRRTTANVKLGGSSRQLTANDTTFRQATQLGKCCVTMDGKGGERGVEFKNNKEAFYRGREWGERMAGWEAARMQGQRTSMCASTVGCFEGESMFCESSGRRRRLPQKTGGREIRRAFGMRDGHNDVYR